MWKVRSRCGRWGRYRDDHDFAMMPQAYCLQTVLCMLCLSLCGQALKRSARDPCQTSMRYKNLYAFDIG